MDLDLELIPHHLRWDIYENGARDGVDPHKVQQKYGSGDGVDAPKKLTSQWYSYGDKNCRWQYPQSMYN